ncbi:ABC transporter ATP-binding protein [Methanosarcina sp. Mfa9]|uniref:ABC transporter ATP-binding protein n=1 Tax=Methanosarcina sp. Mfa9 TaxID=3439063 RepID=UPI003F8483F1
MIEIKNLEVEYENKLVLKASSINIKKGSLCALFGPNGSGKTTLLKCCLGLKTYRSGTIKIEGEDISKISNEKLAKIVAYVPQKHVPSFPFTVEEIVLMGKNPYFKNAFGPDKLHLKQTHQIIKEVGIFHLKDKFYTHLSGGELQLVLLARALNQNTPILLLDEPSSALDYQNQVMIWNKIKELSQAGKTIVVATHDPNHVIWYCDQAVVIKDTAVIENGKPEDVINKNTLDLLYGEIADVEDRGNKKVVIPKQKHF